MTPPVYQVDFNHDNYFGKSHLDIRFPPLPVQKNPSLLEKGWIKICSFFEKIWNTLYFWKNQSKFKLTDHQITLIKEAKENRKYYNLSPQKTTSDKEIIDNKFTKPITPVKPPKEEYKLQYPGDETLTSLCVFIEKFSEILVQDSLNEAQIKPKAPIWKKTILGNLDQLQNWVDVIVNLKKAAAPLFNKIGNVYDPVLTILVQQIFQIFLKPLEKGNNSEKELELALIERSKLLKANNEISNEQFEKILAYIRPTLGWLFNSNNWLINSPHPLLLHHFIIDTLTFLDCFLILAKQGEFNNCLEDIRDQIVRTFESDIQETLHLNTKPIVNMISNRLSNLITQLPYQNNFNNILKVILEQMNGWITANAHFKEQEKLIDDAENDAQQKVTDVKSVTQQQYAQAHLQKVKNIGGKALYLEKEFHQSFSQNACCHEKIRDLIFADSANDALKIDDEIFDNFIETLLTYMFPPIKISLPDGSEFEISSIATIIDQIAFPENLKKIIKKCDQVLQATLDCGKFNDKEKFKSYIAALQKVVITQMVIDNVREGMKEGLRGQFNKLTSKEVLDELVATTVLPSLIDVIYIEWVRSTISRDTEHFSALFLKIIESENDSEKAHNIIARDLFHCMDSQKVDFNMIEAGISETKFKELIIPTIESICTMVKEIKSRDPLKKDPKSEVKLALDEYFKIKKVPDNELYSDIAMNALFKIGNFELPMLGSYTETVVNWFKTSITEGASIAFYDLESSYHKFINSLVYSGNRYYLNAETLNKLLFSPELSIEEQQQKKHKVSELLKNNIYRVSSLAHDVIYRSLESWKGGTLIKKVTPTTKTLNDTISSVFNRMLNRPILNKNIIVKCFDIINSSLKKGLSSPESSPGHMTLENKF